MPTLAHRQAYKFLNFPPPAAVYSSRQGKRKQTLPPKGLPIFSSFVLHVFSFIVPDFDQKGKRSKVANACLFMILYVID
jgi:hypothetical protein